MAARESVPLSKRAVTVSELSVRDIRDWLVEAESGAAVDPLHALAFAEYGLQDLARMCDASADDLEQYPPSELEPLVEACKRINPHFFRVRALLSGTAHVLLHEAATSSAQPAS